MDSNNIEQKVFDALSQAPYTVTLGGREFEFRPMSLSDRQELSIVSNSIPALEQPDNETDILRDSIAAGKHARQAAEIIAVGAHIRGWRMRRVKVWKISIPAGIATEKARRNELFRYVYEHATIEEVYEAIRLIFMNSHPAFFLNIITSLCPKNILKPTKGTEATAPGQSRPE